MWHNDLGRGEGAALCVLYVAIATRVWRGERLPTHLEAPSRLAGRQPEDDLGDLSRGVALAVLGIVLMTAGGRVAVEGAVRAAAALGVTDSTVGLTLVALATTAELLALVVASRRRGASQLPLSAILGSITCNATTTLGVAALVHPLPASGVRAPALMVVALVGALALLWARRTPRRLLGLALVALYAAFTATRLV